MRYIMAQTTIVLAKCRTELSPRVNELNTRGTVAVACALKGLCTVAPNPLVDRILNSKKGMPHEGASRLLVSPLVFYGPAGKKTDKELRFEDNREGITYVCRALDQSPDAIHKIRDLSAVTFQRDGKNSIYVSVPDDKVAVGRILGCQDGHIEVNGGGIKYQSGRGMVDEDGIPYEPDSSPNPKARLLVRSSEGNFGFFLRSFSRVFGPDSKGNFGWETDGAHQILHLHPPSSRFGVLALVRDMQLFAANAEKALAPLGELGEQVWNTVREQLVKKAEAA